MDKLIKFLFYGLVFILPFFFIPFTFNVLELNKTYLLFFVVWLLALLCLLKMIIRDKQIRVRFDKYDFFLVLFWLASVLSIIFSVDKKASLLGVYGRESSGLMALTTFLALYFIVVHNVRKVDEKENSFPISLEGIVKTFIASGIVVLLLSYFSLFGVWQALVKLSPSLSWLNYLSIENPVHIRREGFSIYLVFLVLASIFTIFFPQKNQKEKRRFFAGLKKALLISVIILSLVLLLFIDFIGAWITLGISLIVFVFIASRAKSLIDFVPRLIFPISIIILSLVFSIFSFRALIGNPQINLPIFRATQEPLPSYKASWEIATSTILESFKNTVLGSGRGTYFYDLTKHRPDELARGGWPAVSISVPKSHLSEILAGEGILGFIFYLFVLFGLLFVFVKPKEIVERAWLKIRKKNLPKAAEETKDAKEEFIRVSLITFLSALIISQIVYYQPVVLGFVFWLGLGIVRLYAPSKEKRFEFKENPGVFLLVETSIIVLLIFIALGWMNVGKFYFADIKYKKGFYEPDLEKKIKYFDRARQLNPYQIKYLDALANALFIQTKNEINKPKDQIDNQKIQGLANATLEIAKNETQIFSSRVLAWQTLANMYRDLIGVAKGDPETLAINSYKKAIDIDPKNPYLYLEIGKIQLGQNKLDEAEESFKKCLEIDPEFVLAKVQMALVLEQRGKSKEAITKLEEIINQYPANIDANFHLGRLYYNQDQIDEAIDRFTITLSLSPYHINARFALALAYEKKGEYQKALEQLQIVNQLNPNNDLVREKIEAIKSKIGGESEKSEPTEQEKTESTTPSESEK